MFKSDKNNDKFVNKKNMDIIEENILSFFYRENILKELDKDKPQKITNMQGDEKINHFEMFYNKYDSFSKVDLPNTNWYLDIQENILNKTSNFFILHGNINDQAIPRWTVENYLKEKIISNLGINNICVLDFVYLNGVKNLGIDFEANSNFEGRFLEATNLLKNNNGTKKALIIKYPEFILSNLENCNAGDRIITCITVLRNLMDDIDFCESGNAIFILIDNIRDLNNQLIQVCSNVTPIEIPYPNINQRYNMINYLNQKTEYMIDNINKLKAIANITSGLNLNHIEKIWRSSIKDRKLSIEKISAYKREILKKEYGDKIDILEPSKYYTLNNYGGMDYIKEYLKEGVIKPIIKGDKEIVPKGMLFMGSPGTGKSFMAKCLASECGINFVELKVSKFISKWVGDTEKNLAKALMCVESLSPCFLFIDEIDQIIQRGDNDSNAVRGNVFQMIMNFMGDSNIRGKVIVIGATNYPNKIDEALKRAGRFDLKLVFTPPLNNKEIESVLKVQLNKINYPIGIEYYSDKFKELIVNLQGYSQSEIELVITKALSLSKRESKNCIDIDSLLKASNFIKKSESDKIEEMIMLAMEECNDLEFLPKELIEKKKENNIIKINWD